MNVPVFIELLDEDVRMPEYARDGDAGMDVHANISDVILPGQTKIIPTGFKLAIPKGYEIQVRPRSGLSYKTSLRIANAPGTIDSGYRDEVGIIVTNISDTDIIDINKYDRIAQIVLNEVPVIEFIKVDKVPDVNNRGGGFGSTGVGGNI